ncbi:hypothetical protein E2542_SST22302 [Spatholobus suberectus]|nr:hypothetical protein E2542_SST22302 [Spatholobus suberectus]
MNEYEDCSGLDLELKLSPPGSSSGNLPNALKSTTSLPPSSRGAYPPSKLDIGDNLGGTSKHELPPLIAMGCARCFMYVMVSKADPKCPKCKNPKLIDKFQVNPTKKLRTGRN